MTTEEPGRVDVREQGQTNGKKTNEKKVKATSKSEEATHRFVGIQGRAKAFKQRNPALIFRCRSLQKKDAFKMKVMRLYGTKVNKTRKILRSWEGSS